MTTTIANLSGVTVVAASSVNVGATARALARTLDIVDADEALLFTDQPCASLPENVRVISIAPLRSTKDYSRFILRELHRWIETSHCMVIQWDGFPVHSERWNPEFLNFDYIGAPWPQFRDGRNVGNGGFSLRSRRLLHACLDPRFDDDGGAEDIVIARRNRKFLEIEHGIRFADTEMAARFSVERPLGSRANHAKALNDAFGFHGVFNMVPVLGENAFSAIYQELDHRDPIRVDLWKIVSQLIGKREGIANALRILRDATFRT